MKNKPKTIDDWEKSLNIDVRFKDATPELRKTILAEIKFQRKQVREEIAEKIMGNYRNMLLVYKGKLPFVVFEGKSDEKEKITIYEQGIKDAVKSINPNTK